MREIFDKIYSWLKSDGFISWLLIIACFRAFAPLGIIILLLKLDVITPEMIFGLFNDKSSAVKEKNQEQRWREYKSISKGMSSVSIDYLSKTSGVDFNVVMRDIQKMVLEGEFGAEAYIDYGLRRLVIASDAAEAKAGYAEGKKQNTVAETSKSGSTKTDRKRKKGKNTYDSRESGLLICGVILCAIGAVGAANAVDTIAAVWGAVTFSMIWKLISFLCVAGAGCALLGVRAGRKKRARRIAGYISIIGERRTVLISELAKAAGVKESTVKKDIEIMLENHLLSDEAYLDIGAGRLVIQRADYQHPEEQDPEPASRYRAIVMEIRQLDDEIEDEMVSEKIRQIAMLTAKIFDVVQDKPEKLPEIKSFMSYYLPTTLKLLRSYRDFEKQGVSGENIDAAKKRIEKILDTLVSGFSQQLDQLFKSDAMDISSDIDVLETMMRRDGLSKDESGFQTGL